MHDCFAWKTSCTLASRRVHGFRYWPCCVPGHMSVQVNFSLAEQLSSSPLCVYVCVDRPSSVAADSQLQRLVRSLLSGSFHVPVLFHYCLRWLHPCWQAARYVLLTPFARQLARLLLHTSSRYRRCSWKGTGHSACNCESQSFSILCLCASAYVQCDTAFSAYAQVMQGWLLYLVSLFEAFSVF